MAQNPSEASLPASLEAITQAVLSFVKAQNWLKSKQIIEQNQSLLLTDEADFVFANLLAQYADDAKATRRIEKRCALLRRCRTEGIDAAFADRLRPAMPDIPPELMARLMAVQSDEELTQLLTEHPELLPVWAAMQQATQQATPDPRQELADKLITFIRAETWSEKKAYLAQHPELLTDEAFKVLSMLIQAQDNPDAIRTLTQHRALLAQACQKGLDAVFAELMTPITPSLDQNALLTLLKALYVCDSPHAVLDLAAQQPALLSDEMDVFLQQVIANTHAQGTAEGEAIANHVSGRHQILRQLRQMMEERGMSAAEVVQAVRTGQKSRSQQQKSSSQQLLSAIQAFGTASSEAERKRIVEQERDLLLSDAALQVFADLLEQCKEDAGAIRTLTKLRDLLRHCQKEGILAAFANRVGSSSEKQGILLEFSELLQQAIEARDGLRMDNSRQTLDRAVAAWQVILREPEITRYPEFAIKVQVELASTLRRRYLARGQSEDLLRAIESYQQALQATPQGSPHRPSILNNLGTALHDHFSLRGVEADLQRAIESYQQALQATPQGSPHRPSILNNLGLGLKERFSFRGVAADLEQAIESYQQALQATSQGSPHHPSILNNLGSALRDRFSFRGVAADLQRAIESYQQALQATAQSSSDRPMFLNSLGLGLQNRFRLRGVAADLERAIESYQQALQSTAQGSPDLPGLLNNLGTALSDRFSLRGVAADLQRAIESYEKGLELLISDLFPAEHRTLSRNLGDVYYEQVGDLAKARQAYEQAAATSEVIHRGIRRRRAKERQAEKNAYLYARLVYCCLATEDQASAFKYATMGKGRTFVDLLSSVQISLSNLPEKDKPLQKKVTQARQLKVQLDAMSGQLLGERPSIKPSPQDASLPQQLSKVQQAKLMKDLKRLRQQDKVLWQEIRDQFPDYFATQSAEPFTLAEAQGLASQLDATLVSYYRHDKGWVAFVIRPDLPADTSLKVVDLSVTDEQLREWAVKFNSGLADRTLVNLRWSKKMSGALITPLLAHLSSPTAAVPARRRSEELPVEGEPAERHLVLAPFSRLHLLPLATLPRTPIPWRKSGLPQVRYLSDEYEVAMTPSLAMLKRVMDRRQRGEKREKLCAVAYPGRKGSKHYLKHVLPEAQAIAQRFPKYMTRLNDDATPKAAILDVKGVDVAHYSCHGLFNPQEVEQSSLLLAGGMLTLRDIFNEVRLPNASLVTLSACETGMALPRLGDELAGMVQGFVYAGTPTVIASLWAVNDAATRYLFERFYEHYTTGIAASEALRTAQQELRQHNYAHPYYWAAFQAVGAAYDSLPITSRSIRPAKEVIQPPTSSKTKGAYPMSIPTAQAILDKAQRILQNIEPFASDIAQELTAEERSTFLATLEKLVILAETISKESQLQLASDIISAFEAIPLLRENFVGDVDPETEQNKRQLTLQAALEGAKPLPSTRQETQQVDNIYHIPLKKVCQLLREQQEEQQQSEEGESTGNM